jgi:hypothetical protein
MSSSGILHPVAFLRTDVSDKPIASIVSVTEIGELLLVFLRSVLRLLVVANVVPTSPILVTVMLDAMFLLNVGFIRAIQRNILEDAILHSHRRENLKIYKTLFKIEYLHQCLSFTDIQLYRNIPFTCLRRQLLNFTF